jgi:hypothetical protein
MTSRDRLDETSHRIQTRLAAELADLDPEAAMIAELIRRGVVEDVAELLKPGMGPMTIPADVAELLASFPPWSSQAIVHAGAYPHDVRLLTRTEGGRVSLELHVDAYRVWDGVLRPGTHRIWPAAA